MGQETLVKTVCVRHRMSRSVCRGVSHEWSSNVVQSFIDT